MNKLLWLFRKTEKKKILYCAVVLSMAAALLRQGVTYFLGEAVNAASSNRLPETLIQMGWLLTGILILVLIDYLSKYSYGHFTYQNLYWFRSRMTKTVLQFTLKDKSKYTTGALINRMNSDLQILERFFGQVVQDTAYKIFIGIFATVFGLFIQYKVMLILLLFCAVTAIVNYYFAKPMEKIQREIQELSDRIMTSFQDAIHGNKEIKAYKMKDVLNTKFGDYVKTHLKKSLTAARIESLWGAIEITVSIGLQISTIFLCLFFVLRDEMTLGDVIIFQQLVEMTKMIFVIDFVNINKALAVISRVDELWGSGAANQQPGQITSGQENSPVLEFQQVNFSYNQLQNEGRSNCLQDISFTVNPNERVSIVGPSGSGKSTIINMICGLLTPDTGSILFQGYDLQEWDNQALYSRISLVDQECRLFPVSMYENIAVGGYGICGVEQADIEAQVSKMLETVSLTKWISTLEDKEQTDVGEYGSRISGGQRQRISIARALLKSPILLMMDEPTSSLDVQTEMEVMTSLYEKLKNKAATITVAHRLATIQHSDKILVLNHGRIEEQGTHQSLMAQKGLYYRMYLQQNSEYLEAPYEA